MTRNYSSIRLEALARQKERDKRSAERRQEMLKNDPIKLAAIREQNMRKINEEIADYEIVHILQKAGFTGYTRKTLPPELIELKKLLIAIQRRIKDVEGKKYRRATRSSARYVRPA